MLFLKIGGLCRWVVLFGVWTTLAAARAGSLLLSATGGGTLSAQPPAGTVTDGTVVTVTAASPAGTWLQAWGGAVPVTERWTGRTSVQITVNGATSVTAQFGQKPPVRLFKMGGENFRSFRLSPDGRHALGTIHPDPDNNGYPAVRDRETRAMTQLLPGFGQLFSISADGQTAVGTTNNGATPSFQWTPQGVTYYGASGGVFSTDNLYAHDISLDGRVTGVARFIGGKEHVSAGSPAGGFPALSQPVEFYGALAGDGRTLYSFKAYKTLVTHDLVTGTRTESAPFTNWNFYPYNAEVHFPAATSYDGSVLTATFYDATTSKYLAAVRRSGEWLPMGGGSPSIVYCLSGNGKVATGSTINAWTPAIWKLDGAAPVHMTPAAWLTETGAWLAPLSFTGVGDVSDDGNTLLLHDNSRIRYDGNDSSWIAIRPVIQPQTITFAPPAATTEGGLPVDLPVGASSGLPVSLRLVSGPGRIEGATYFPQEAGMAVIEATQAGGINDFLPAPAVMRSVVVADDPALAELVLATTGNGQISGAPAGRFIPIGTVIPLLADPVGGGGHAFHSWQIDFTPVGAGGIGSTALTSSLPLNPENGRYVLTARFAPAQTITFDLPASMREDTFRLPVTASASSGLPVSLTLVSGPGSLVNGFYYPISPGEVVFLATQSGNGSTAPAPGVLRTLTVLPDTSPPSLELDQPPARIVADRPVTISGRVTDEASTILLQLINGAGQIVQSASPTSGQPFSFPGVALERGTNSFLLRATGGRLITEQRLTITWEPRHIFRLAGPATTPEARNFSLDLEVSSAGGLAGMTVEVTLPAPSFHLPTFEPSGILALAMIDVNNTIPGKLRFTLASLGLPLPAGNIRLGSVKLRPRSFGTFPAAAAFGLSINGVSDDKGNAITTGLHAEGHSLTLLPRQHTGDINNNNRWDVGDAVRLQRFLIGLDVAQAWDHPLNDLNGSGAMDSGDVIKILRAAAMLDPNIPLVQPLNGRSPRGNVERVFLSILNPDARPGEILTLQLKTENLAEPLPGVSFAVDFPTGLLQPEGTLPISLTSSAPVGAAQRTGVVNGAGEGFSRLTFAVSSAQPFGVAGQSMVLATISLKILPGAAAAAVIPIRLAEVALSGTDGYEIRQAGPDTTSFRPTGITFAHWQRAIFGEAPSGPPLAAGYSADPDLDGIPNGLEYLMGGNPMDRNSPPPPGIVTGQDGMARMRFFRHPGTQLNQLNVEWSAGLSELWTTAGLVEESSIEGPDGLHEVTMRLPGTMVEYPRRWIRLRASP